MGRVTFHSEPLTYALWTEAWPLLYAHWREIGHYQDIDLEPDVQLYMSMTRQGNLLRVYTARTEEHQLVGYALFFVRSNPHYKSSVQAVQDVLFIERAYRVGSLGARFVRYCESMLREHEHVQAIYHHVKAAHNTFGRLLEHDGYELVDLIYAKRVN